MAGKGINPACFLPLTNKKAQLPRNRTVIEEKCSGPERQSKGNQQVARNGSKEAT
jgi:hypothetical protein